MIEDLHTQKDLLSDWSFIRWVEGEAERSEARVWDEWIRQSEHNRKLAAEAQSQLLGMGAHGFARSESQWLRLLARIRNTENGGLYGGKRKCNHAVISWMYRIAAIVLSVTFAGYFAYYTGLQSEKDALEAELYWQHVETDYAEHKKINLTDGSTIILGSHSSLVYPRGWVVENSIEVWLKGEAYFHIAKKKENEPVFRVKTTDGMVEVRGTRFAIDADETRTRVVLEEGAVSIHEADKPETVELKPNEKAEFSRHNSNVNIEQVNPEVYTSWTHEVMRLDNTPFRLVADRIQKTFGVKVEVMNPELYDRKLTGTLNLKSTGHLVIAVAEVLENEIKQENDTIVFGSAK